MLKDIDKLRAEFEAKLAEAARQNTIADTLPIYPHRIHTPSSGAPWVTYKAKTLAEALQILKAYTLLPWVIAKGTFTTLGIREDIDTERYKYDRFTEIEDGAPYFECQQGVGYDTNTMVFFTQVEGTTLAIHIDIDHLPFGPRLVLLDRNARLSDHNKYRKDYCESMIAADILKWGYGDDCVKATYWFRDLASFDLAMDGFVERTETA